MINQPWPYLDRCLSATHLCLWPRLNTLLSALLVEFVFLTNCLAKPQTFLNVSCLSPLPASRIHYKHSPLCFVLFLAFSVTSDLLRGSLDLSSSVVVWLIVSSLNVQLNENCGNHEDRFTWDFLSPPSYFTSFFAAKIQIQSSFLRTFYAWIYTLFFTVFPLSLSYFVQKLKGTCSSFELHRLSIKCSHYSNLGLLFSLFSKSLNSLLTWLFLPLFHGLKI